MLFETTKRIISKTGIVIFPREIYETYGTALVVCKSASPRAVDVYSYEQWESIEKKLMALPPTSSHIKRFMIGSATELHCGENRKVRLPLELCDWARILGDKQLTIVMVPGSHRVSIQNEHILQQSIDRAMQDEIYADQLFRSARKAKDLEDLELCLKRAAAQGDFRAVEALIAESFEYFGETIVELTQYSKDDGIDVVLHTRNKVSGERELIYVQCKAGKHPVTVQTLREATGVVCRDGANGGIIVSGAGFTNECVSEAKRSLVKMKLIDIPHLVKFISENTEYKISSDSYIDI